MDKTVIILARGSSSGFGEDKGLLKLNNKPLISHVVDAVKGIVDEVIIATSSKERADLYSKILPYSVRFAIEPRELEEPLIGALNGFEAAEGKYSLLLPFDGPFVSKEVVSLLFELCIGKSAVVPRSPDCKIEPLHAVYYTEQALQAAKKAFADNELDMGAMISKMRGVRYISTLVIEQLDPDLRSFFNVKTPFDLKKAMIMAKPRKNKRAPG